MTKIACMHKFLPYKQLFHNICGCKYIKHKHQRHVLFMCIMKYLIYVLNFAGEVELTLPLPLVAFD